MLDCDWCKADFPLAWLYNVEYVGEKANVLCAQCVGEAHDLFLDTIIGVWQ